MQHQKKSYICHQYNRLLQSLTFPNLSLQPECHSVQTSLQLVSIQCYSCFHSLSPASTSTSVENTNAHQRSNNPNEETIQVAALGMDKWAPEWEAQLGATLAAFWEHMRAALSTRTIMIIIVCVSSSSHATSFCTFHLSTYRQSMGAL